MSQEIQHLIQEVARVNRRLDQTEATYNRTRKVWARLETGLQEVQDLKTSMEQALAKSEKFKNLTKTASALAKLEADLEGSRVAEEQLASVMTKLTDLQSTVDFFAQKVSNL